LDQAILFENIAIAYRGTENYKLMVSNLKKALELYEKAGDTYRVCVALKNMGEAEWYFGFREQASEFFKKSEDLSNNLDPIKHSDVFWNLACAFRRIGDEKIERKYLEKCLALLPLTEAQRSYQVEERLLELTL
jgi:tetratricopeptide (TPR) repeat protein